jgi:hypothetical protein
MTCPVCTGKRTDAAAIAAHNLACATTGERSYPVARWTPKRVRLNA